MNYPILDPIAFGFVIGCLFGWAIAYAWRNR